MGIMKEDGMTDESEQGSGRGRRMKSVTKVFLQCISMKER